MTGTEAQAFEEAIQYELLDDDIERARTLLGVDVASRQREHLTTVTPDAIRTFACGVGDDNPLYADEEHGESTRWGGQVGPNIMAGVVNTPLLGDPLPEELERSTKSLFRGFKANVTEALRLPLDGFLPRESRRQVEAGRTDEHRAAVTAWLEARRKR